MSSYLASDFKPLLLSLSVADGETSQTQRKTKKKRTRQLTIGGGGGDGETSDSPRPRTSRKPDPSAPKITRPCTECGKKFWSWKALFGHMRCHPERQWRGINPPPNLQRGGFLVAEAAESSSSATEEDHEVAACLLMMSCSQPACAKLSLENFSDSAANAAVGYSSDDHVIDSVAGRFECSSCRKVFGSHQALGGHRASHKNVKGCYAITKNDGEDDGGGGCWSGGGYPTGARTSGGHKCGICLRVFSSGQALGGHMRCHWEEKAVGVDFDLNLTAQDEEEEEDSDGKSIGGLTLDLRLGI